MLANVGIVFFVVSARLCMGLSMYVDVCAKLFCDRVVKVVRHLYRVQVSAGNGCKLEAM